MEKKIWFSKRSRPKQTQLISSRSNIAQRLLLNAGVLVACMNPLENLNSRTNVRFSRFTIVNAYTLSTQCQCWKTTGSLKAQPEIFSKPHVSFIHFNRKRRGTREIPFIFFPSSRTKRVWLNTTRSMTRALEKKVSSSQHTTRFNNTQAMFGEEA